MNRTFRRARHLAQLVVDTIARDRAWRTLRAADAALSTPEDAAAPATTDVPSGAGLQIVADFPTIAPAPPRRLPARRVAPTTPAEYRDALEAAVRSELREGGIPVARIPGEPGRGATLAVRQQDWGRALELLDATSMPVLLANSESIAPSTVPFVRPGTLAASGHHPLVHVLSPAVVQDTARWVQHLGFDTTVCIQRWDDVPTEGEEPPAPWLRAPTWNPRTALLNAHAFTCEEQDGGTPQDPTLALPHLFEVNFPIDVVYTWVDGTDPEWLRRKSEALRADLGHSLTEDAAADLRFVDHDELRYSLRSLELYAPWVRSVYIVTDRQRPPWLREDHPRIRVVDHTEIAPPGTALPTFNSQAIEANLHRIDGLSEHFLYFNDDVFLSSPVGPELFFHANGLASMFPSRAQVAPGDPIPGEPASDSAGKNARTLVEQVSGRRVSRKLFHTAFALQRSISQEIEDRWPEVVASTRASTLRRTTDVTLAGALHMNYAYTTARAVSRGLKYRYVNVAAADAAQRLESLMQDRDVLQTFCLNEASPELDPRTIDSLVRSFLERRYPDRGTFEKPGA